MGAQSRRWVPASALLLGVVSTSGAPAGGAGSGAVLSAASSDSASWPEPKLRAGAFSLVAQQQQQQAGEKNFTHEENGVWVKSYPPWCPAKGCNWAHELTTREQLDNNTAMDPAVLLFYVTNSAKGQALKSVFTKVAEKVNTKNFNKGTRPLLRFFTFDVDGHQGIAQAYGVKYDGHPQIFYFPGGKAPQVRKADGSPGTWRDSRWESVPMDDDLVMKDGHNLVTVTDQSGEHTQQQQGDEAGMIPMEDKLENFIRLEHQHAFGGVHIQGRHTWDATPDELAGIPANCDGDECNDLDCQEGYHTQVVLIGGKISVGDCECKCHPDSMYDPAVVAKYKAEKGQQQDDQQQQADQPQAKEDKEAKAKKAKQA